MPITTALRALSWALAFILAVPLSIARVFTGQGGLFPTGGDDQGFLWSHDDDDDPSNDRDRPYAAPSVRQLAEGIYILIVVIIVVLVVGFVAYVMGRLTDIIVELRQVRLEKLVLDVDMLEARFERVERRKGRAELDRIAELAEKVDPYRAFPPAYPSVAPLDARTLENLLLLNR